MRVLKVFNLELNSVSTCPAFFLFHLHFLSCALNTNIVVCIKRGIVVSLKHLHPIALLFCLVTSVNLRCVSQ